MEARAGQLQRREVGQDFERCLEIRSQLAFQPSAEAVAKRVAGGQNGDGQALGDGGLRPFRHFAERAVHVMSRHVGGKMGADEVERAPCTDDDLCVGEALPGGIRKAGHAVVKDAYQG